LAARLNRYDLPYWITFILLLALAYGLRASSAQSRPLHADEGVQAFTTAELQASGIYEYTAEDRHGPTLYYFSSWLNKARGIDPDDLTNFDLRLLFIIFSIATLRLLAVPFRSDKRALLIVTAILGTTPLSIIYGAYFVQESLFVFLIVGIVIFSHRLLHSPSMPTGLFLGYKPPKRHRFSSTVQWA